MKPDFLAQPELQEVLEVLGKANTRIVGGAVRDALMGRGVADIDLATTLPPQEVMERAKAAGFAAIPTGVQHGTVTVVVRGKVFEVTTLRRDETTDGRHAVVAFGQDWKEDAHRRDFTINALYRDAEGRIYDYVDGLKDIEKRRVRFIGEAQTRIREDYLRILRFFRFHAVCGEGELDRAGLAACAKEKDGLRTISRERVRHEFLKILTAATAVQVVEAMQETGILDLVLPQADTATWKRLRECEAQSHTLPDAMRGLAALTLQSSHTPADVARLLRLSGDEKKQLEKLSKPGFANNENSIMFKEKLYRLGQDFSSHVLLAAAAGNLPQWREALNFQKINLIPTFSLYGKDILNQGIPSGPHIGVILKKAESLWIAEGFPQDPQNTAKILAQAINLFYRK